MRIRSFKFMIPAVIIVFVLSVNILNAVVITNIVRNHAMNEALDKNLVIAGAIGDKLSLYMEDAVRVMRASTREINKNPRDMERLRYEIDRLYENYAQFDLVFFHDQSGRLLYSNPANPQAQANYTYTDRDYFQHVMATGEVYVSRMYTSRVLKVPHFVVAAPVLDEDRKVIGVLGAGISLSNIHRVARDNKKPFNGGIRIVDAAGALMADPERNLSNEVVLVEDFAVKMNGRSTGLYTLLAEKAEGAGIMTRGGKVYYDVITYVGNLGWMIMLEQSEDVILEEVYALTDRLRGMIFGTLGVGLVIGLLLVRRITEPVKKLVSSVERLGRGEFDNSDFKDEYQNEIGDLYRAFKEMAGRLDDKMVQLEGALLRESRLQQFLNNIIMSAGSGILVASREGRVIIFNNALENITGYAKGRFLGEPVDLLYQALDVDFPRVIDEITETGRNVSDFEQRICRSNGKRIRCLVNISALRDADGSQNGFVFFFKNVENERVMEERLKRDDRISTLGRFTSSVIHEIGNPLAGLANLLEAYEEADEAERAEIIALVSKEIKDLNEIVINYLHFAGQNSPIYAVSNVQQIIYEILAILKAEIEKKNIRVVFDCQMPHPFARVDRRGIKQAFINILSNSVQAIERDGEISIGICQKDERILVAFADDGEGIPEEDREKIFDLFYSTKEAGTGLGLSIAYKIIRDHGGGISVESRPGGGSCFIISLPL